MRDIQGTAGLTLGTFGAARPGRHFRAAIRRPSLPAAAHRRSLAATVSFTDNVPTISGPNSIHDVASELP